MPPKREQKKAPVGRPRKSAQEKAAEHQEASKGARKALITSRRAKDVIVVDADNDNGKGKGSSSRDNNSSSSSSIESKQAEIQRAGARELNVLNRSLGIDDDDEVQITKVIKHVKREEPDYGLYKMATHTGERIMTKGCSTRDVMIKNRFDFGEMYYRMYYPLFRQILAKLNLSTWKVATHSCDKAAGATDLRNKIISISTTLIRKADAKSVIHTFIHECAHALVGQLPPDEDYHGPVWINMMLKLGQRPNKTHTLILSKSVMAGVLPDKMRDVDPEEFYETYYTEQALLDDRIRNARKDLNVADAWQFIDNL